MKIVSVVTVIKIDVWHKLCCVGSLNLCKTGPGKSLKSLHLMTMWNLFVAFDRCCWHGKHAGIFLIQHYLISFCVGMFSF